MNLTKIKVPAEHRLLAASAIVYIICYISLCFGFCAATGSGGSWKADMMMFFGEGCLWAILPVVLRGRWRAISVVWLWVVTLYFFANTVYCRYWGDLLPYSLVVNPKSYNGLVLQATAGMLAWKDILWTVPGGLFTFWYIMARMSRLPALGLRGCLASVAAGLLLYCAGVLAETMSVRRYAANNAVEFDMKDAFKSLTGPASSRLQLWHGSGLILYNVKHLKSLAASSRLRLTEEERASVGRFVDGCVAACDSTFAANERKNLIFIVVESLNAWTVGKRYGEHSLTPVLDSLIAATGTISALNVVPQIKDGGSSDGQMIYNTGLLPVKEGSTAMLFGGNRFLSLAEATGYEDRVEFIVEDASIWNHAETSRSYGYTYIFDKLDTSAGSQDSVLFAKALEEIPRLSTPFMAEITTLSMHHPYNDAGVPRESWIEALDTIEPLRKNYLHATHHFDCVLGDFLERLDDEGILEQSVVVLASDHDQFSSSAEMQSGVKLPIVFMALNTGVQRRIEHSVGQVDVFPTVMQIMHRCGEWRGVGTSMLGDGLSEEAEMRMAGVSDTIIRSNFFEDYQRLNR